MKVIKLNTAQPPHQRLIYASGASCSCSTSTSCIAGLGIGISGGAGLLVCAGIYLYINFHKPTIK